MQRQQTHPGGLHQGVAGQSVPSVGGGGSEFVGGDGTSMAMMPVMTSYPSGMGLSGQYPAHMMVPSRAVSHPHSGMTGHPQLSQALASQIHRGSVQSQSMIPTGSMSSSMPTSNISTSQTSAASVPVRTQAPPLSDSLTYQQIYQELQRYQKSLAQQLETYRAKPQRTPHDEGLIAFLEKALAVIARPESRDETEIRAVYDALTAKSRLAAAQSMSSAGQTGSQAAYGALSSQSRLPASSQSHPGLTPGHPSQQQQQQV